MTLMLTFDIFFFISKAYTRNKKIDKNLHICVFDVILLYYESGEGVGRYMLIL